ncbi:Beta-carotene isomerase D27 chloroplastic [Bienertia sinuspersici]
MPSNFHSFFPDDDDDDDIGWNTQIFISSIPAGTLSNAYNPTWRGENRCYDARVTVITCQWLMGPCSVNSIELRDGSSCQSGVLVERCKYLEESKCVGICVNTCKLPTQVRGKNNFQVCINTFFKDHMGIPLLMEPNFSDYSCQTFHMHNIQFKFGVSPPTPENDSALKEPCLDSCPYVAQRGSKVVDRLSNAKQCPRS